MLICLMDYISKCDNVVCVVIKEITSSKNTFSFFGRKRENLLGKITSVNITKNSY